MLKLVLKGVVAATLLIGYVGVAVVWGQEKEPVKIVKSATGSEGSAKFKTDLPKEVKIPEARTDKVLLFQEQGRNVQLEQQAAIDRFRASEEWKALEARQKLALDKLEAELRSALKLAGVEEVDFAKYKYDQTTLKFTFVEPAKAEPKK
jgi:hypothetical protein